MPIYTYRNGDTHTAEVYAERHQKPELDRRMKGMGFRPDYRSVQIAPVMQAHWNASTGTIVSSPKQFERELKRSSEEATERTGIPHNYVPVDVSDTTALGVTDEGLDATYDAAHDGAQR